MIALTQYQELELRNAVAQQVYRLDSDIQARAACDRAVPSQREAVWLLWPQTPEDLRVRGVHNRGDFMRRYSCRRQAVAMRLVYGKHMIGEPGAKPLFNGEHSCADRATPSAKLFAVQLRHCVMDIQHDPGAMKLQRKCGQHNRIRHRRNDCQIVAAVRSCQAKRRCGRLDEEREINLRVPKMARTAVARHVHRHHVDTVENAGVVCQSDRVDLITPFGERLSVTSDSTVRGVPGVCYGYYASHFVLSHPYQSYSASTCNVSHPVSPIRYKHN